MNIFLVQMFITLSYHLLRLNLDVSHLLMDGWSVAQFTDEIILGHFISSEIFKF